MLGKNTGSRFQGLETGKAGLAAGCRYSARMKVDFHMACIKWRRSSWLALLLLLGAGCLAPREQVSLDSPEAVTRFLEQRWPIERLKEFCIGDAIHAPDHQWLVPHHGPQWEGHLHTTSTNVFSEIRWYGSASNGVLMDFQLCATKNGHDWWRVDGADDASRLKPLDDDGLFIKRMWYVMYNTLNFRSSFHGEILDPANEDTSEVREFCRHHDLFFHDDETRKTWLERDRATGRPIKYIQVQNSPGRDRLEIILDAKGNPTEFCLNGKLDKYFTDAYQEFHENYSRYLSWINEQELIRSGEKQGQLMDKPNWGQWNWGSSTNQTTPQK